MGMLTPMTVIPIVHHPHDLPRTCVYLTDGATPTNPIVEIGWITDSDRTDAISTIVVIPWMRRVLGTDLHLGPIPWIDMPLGEDHRLEHGAPTWVGRTRPMTGYP